VQLLTASCEGIERPSSDQGETEMSYVEMTEIASGARELTDTELAMVGGGGLLAAVEAAAAWAGGIIGYLVAGGPGAAAGSIAASATVGAINDSNNYGGMTANYF
jgi:hypothetical protein